MSEIFKAVELPGKEYTSKEAMFDDLHANKGKIIAAKRAVIKHTDSIGVNALRDVLATKGMKLDEGFIYSVINTTKYMDSHSDVHLNGIWNKSVNEQQGKIMFVADHSTKIADIIAYSSDVEMMLKELKWSELGANFDGTTQALIFKVDKDAIVHEKAKQIIEQKRPIQHSVRMGYVDFKLAMDSANPDHADSKANWDNTIGLVANKDKAIEQGYYWTVSEAKILMEGSMVVAGSNDVTPMLTSKGIEPPSGTHKTEPSNDTPPTNKNVGLGLHNY